jgi:hypothetical protein
MRLVLLAIIAVVTVQWPHHAGAQSLPVIDFQRYFPHFIATSEEVRDQRSPNGLQWKFITVRDEQDDIVWVTLRRREGEDRVTQAFLAKGPLEGSEATFRGAVAKFSETEKVRFEIVDLRDIRTFATFSERAGSLGWGMQALPK